MRRLYFSARARLGVALGISSLASLGLYVVGLWGSKDDAFGYLPWNLLLAWIALCIALWLERILRTSLWSGWYALFVTALWLAFLPNTFYMISDFVHIQEAGVADLLYDVVLFSSFIFNGVVLGILSLGLVHGQLLRRAGRRTAAAMVGAVLFLCSFAIYIGRELRWSTWDIVANPSSLLFDVSDKVLNPHEHPRAFTTTISFFVLLGSMYVVTWYAFRVNRQQRED